MLKQKQGKPGDEEKPLSARERAAVPVDDILGKLEAERESRLPTTKLKERRICCCGDPDCTVFDDCPEPGSPADVLMKSQVKYYLRMKGERRR
jgi:hypothetical protein